MKQKVAAIYAAGFGALAIAFVGVLFVRRHCETGRRRSAAAAGQCRAVPFGEGMILEQCYAPPGEFLMGSNKGYPHEIPYGDDECPVHKVVLTRGFYIGKYEVTRAQYSHVMGAPKGWRAGDLPYWNASWDDANEFCARLSRRTGMVFRLPTEAEWEYACRAGADTAFCFGGGIDKLRDYAWCADSLPLAVGGKLPNAWGVHDMHGNVWEWCRDCYDPTYYARSPSVDPSGPEAGKYRVVRGGACNQGALHSRCAARGRSLPKGDQTFIGFRVVCEVVQGEPVRRNDAVDSDGHTGTVESAR